MNTPPTSADMLFGKRLAALAEAIVAVCPMWGFVSADVNTKAVVVDFKASATQNQKDQSATIIAGWDWTEAGDTAYRDQKEPYLSDIRDQAQSAFDSNTTYLALVAPSNPQVVAQVRLLTQENQKLIKALARLAVKNI